MVTRETEIFYYSHAEDAICDIVYVHGLNGHVHDTWKRDGVRIENSWPKWIANVLPTVAVSSVSYDASSSDWLGHGMPIIDRATNLLRLMEVNGIGRRPAVFITHSLGGLLVKQMLRHAEGLGAPEWEAFRQNVRLVLFIATPHQGSAIPSYLDALRTVYRPSALLQNLHSNDPLLIDLNEWFREYVRRSDLQVTSFHETIETMGLMVVGRASADFGYPGMISTGIERNHIDICKPTKSEDLVVALTLCRIRDILAQLPHSLPHYTPVTTLSYCNTTEIDLAVVDALLDSAGPHEIQYHDEIARTLSLLNQYDINPKPFLAKVPYLQNEQNLRKREEEAAIYHLRIHETNVAVKKAMIENRRDLSRFISWLKADLVDRELAMRAVATFGAFAALSIIRILKRFYDIEDGNLVLFFENFAFNQDASYCYLDWTPRDSPTGKRVFGYYYYVGARAGTNDSRYEYVMLPLEIARRLCKNGGGGDINTFYEWVLPQLFIVGCHFDIEDYSAKNWRIVLLQGAYGVEQQITPLDDPWKDYRG